MSGVTTIEALKDWFFGQPNKYWTLYRTHCDSKAGGKVIIRNSNQSDKDLSWEWLEKTITDQSKDGGKFTVFASEKPGGNYGMTTFATLPKQMNQANSINGLQPSGGIYGTDFKTFVGEQVTSAVERNNLQRDIEDLRAALQADSSGTTIGKLVEFVVSDPQGAATVISTCFQNIGMLINIAMQKPAAPTPTMNGTRVTMEGVSTPACEDPEIDECLNTISTIGDEKTVLAKLARFIESNPEQAAQLFNQLP